MLFVDMIIPLTMFGFGKYFLKGGPKEINGVFGYRTPMSTKNEETWEFAHKYCGKIWYRCGIISLPLSAAAMLFVLGKNEELIGMTGAVIMGVQLAVLIISIFPTEAALKKTFDKYGFRK